MTEPCPSCNTYPPWHRIDCEACPAPYRESIQPAPEIWVFGGIYKEPMLRQSDPGWWRYERKRGGKGTPTHWMPKPEGPREE